MCQNLLFVHAILGCDTTSRIFGFGKAIALKLIQTSQKFIEHAQVFNQEGCTQNEVAVSGEKAIMCLYKTNSKVCDLNSLRHQKLIDFIKTSSKAIQPKQLPPSSAATKFHSFRVYHQIQTWKNRKLDPENWGWKSVDGRMIPIQTKQEIAPKELLQFGRCHCKTGCVTKQCSCRKMGIGCTTACGSCKGVCQNMGEEIECDGVTDDIDEADL